MRILLLLAGIVLASPLVSAGTVCGHFSYVSDGGAFYLGLSDEDRLPGAALYRAGFVTNDLWEKATQYEKAGVSVCATGILGTGPDDIYIKTMRVR